MNGQPTPRSEALNGTGEISVWKMRDHEGSVAPNSRSVRWTGGTKRVPVSWPVTYDSQTSPRSIWMVADTKPRRVRPCHSKYGGPNWRMEGEGLDGRRNG